MPRPKGSKNKITAKKTPDTVVNRIDVDAMTTDQKLIEEAHKRNLSLKEYLRLLVINL